MVQYQWYVLRTQSKHEKKIKGIIELEVQRGGLKAEVISQVVVPTEKVYGIKQGKRRIVEKSFFPGYLLVQADLSKGETIHFIRSIPGVIGWVGNPGTGGLEPTPLREHETNRIMGRINQTTQEAEEGLETRFLVGEQVRVTDGPFSGFDGSIQEIFEERKKLNIIVMIFGRRTPVELNYAQVEKQE